MFVEELRFRHPEADHQRREISDDLDQWSTIYAIIDQHEEVLGTLRCTVLGDVPNQDEILERRQLRPFAERFGVVSIATTSRFMLDRRIRKSSAIRRFIDVGVDLALARGVRFNFGETNSIWLRYFERLGYRRFTEGVNDPVFGYHLPIVMLVRDMSYLRRAKSPLLRLFAEHEHDREAADWFARYASDYRALSALEVGGSAHDRLLAIGVAPASLAAWERSLPSLLYDDLILHTDVLILRDGDILTTAGEVDQTAFVCLKGALRREDEHGRDCGTVTVGQGFAEAEFFSGGIRRETTVALADTVVLILTASHMRRIGRYPGVAEALFSKRPKDEGGQC
ncbi:cyclic nucleotide-binding domain-containing protein [Mesorhizobium sp. IMUNJ 23033]|uniref:cyclic nucleotide-binding domain-containing protein n=1 Tax=Mesorhizobium sp. IMUNJ 23033 TaxID=3378039 RepID=UPI003850D66E